MVLTKHASNDPRGGPNPEESEIILNDRWFKNLAIQKTWNLEFKKRHIISGRDLEKSFPRNFAYQMLAPMDKLEWSNFCPISKCVYTKLVRAFYCNLEVRNLDNVEFTIDIKVRGKDIVLNPSILSDITVIPNEGEFIFISKPSHLTKYMSKRQLYDVIAEDGAKKVTDTKHLRPEFRISIHCL